MTITTLGQAAEIRLGRQRSPQHESGEHMLPYLRSANVLDGALDLRDVKQMNFTPSEQAIFQLEAGDVLVTEGSGSRDTVGTSAVWREELPGTVCFQNTLLRLRPRLGVTDGRFLAWWMRHARLSGRIALVSGGANILHLGAEGLRGLSIELPPVEEQQQIADFLDDRVAHIDQIIASRRDQIELLADAQRAVADSVLRTAGDVSTTRFGYYIRAIEQGWSPQCDSAPAMPGEWGVLKVSAVWAGEFRPHENKALPADLDPLRQYEVGPGDLLVSRANTPTRVGAFGVVPEGAPENLILCDKLMRLTLDGRVTADFANLFGQTKNVRDALSGSGTGTSGSMVNIRGADIRDLRIPVMDVERQGQLVSRWRRENDVLLSGKATIERQIAALTEYKQSLITAAVTGEFDVTTASTRIPGEHA